MTLYNYAKKRLEHKKIHGKSFYDFSGLSPKEVCNKDSLLRRHYYKLGESSVEHYIKDFNNYVLTKIND